MSDSPQISKRSIGRPFWIGCLIGSISFIAFCPLLGLLPFVDAFLAILFGLIIGALNQVAHDISVARRLRLLHVWDFLVFTAIAVVLLGAGEALFHASTRQSDMNPFSNHPFDIAVAFVLLMLIVYTMSKSRDNWLSRRTWMAFLLKIWSDASELFYTD